MKIVIIAHNFLPSFTLNTKLMRISNKHKNHANMTSMALKYNSQDVENVNKLYEE